MNLGLNTSLLTDMDRTNIILYYSLLACQFLASNMWSTTYFPISCRGLVTKIALLQYSIEDMLLKLKNLNTPYEDMY